MSFAFGARSSTCSYRRPGCPSSGPCAVWQNGVSTSSAEREAEEARVVVQDVELVGLAEGVRRVLQLPVRVPDPLARRRVEDGLEPRPRLRVARGEERDVVAVVDEPVREKRDDALGSSVRLRRNREPRRAHDADPHCADRLIRLRQSLPGRARLQSSRFGRMPARPRVATRRASSEARRRRSRSAAAARGRARARAAPGRAGSACRRPRPAGGRRSGYAIGNGVSSRA